MTAPLIVALPGNEEFADGLCGALGGDRGGVAVRSFPDGETYFRHESHVAGRDVVLVCTLDRPDAKFLPLVFAAAAARNLGAASVGLAAPYLAYMRQDRAFNPGEAVTSEIFAKTLSRRCQSKLG